MPFTCPVVVEIWICEGLVRVIVVVGAPFLLSAIRHAFRVAGGFNDHRPLLTLDVALWERR